MQFLEFLSEQKLNILKGQSLKKIKFKFMHLLLTRIKKRIIVLI